MWSSIHFHLLSSVYFWMIIEMCDSLVIMFCLLRFCYHAKQSQHYYEWLIYHLTDPQTLIFLKLKKLHVYPHIQKPNNVPCHHLKFFHIVSPKIPDSIISPFSPRPKTPTRLSLWRFFLFFNLFWYLSLFLENKMQLLEWAPSFSSIIALSHFAVYSC